MKFTRRTESNIGITELKEAIMSGNGAEVLAPGDELEITFTNGKTAAVTFAGFIGKERGRFIFRDCIDRHMMHSYPDNTDGYFKSEGRRHVLEDLLPLLPEELREALTPRTITETVNGETIKYSDPLWVPSGTDIFGMEYAGTWYEKDRNDRGLPVFQMQRQKVKDLKGTTTLWWLRSRYLRDKKSFIRINWLAESVIATRIFNPVSRRALIYRKGAGKC